MIIRDMRSVLVILLILCYLNSINVCGTDTTLPYRYIHIWVHIPLLLLMNILLMDVLGGELYSVISCHLWIQIRIGNEITAGLGHPMCIQ